jgi:hypothetical protein
MTDEFIGKRVKLKDKEIELYGFIKELHLAADESYTRPKDLYRVAWDNGKTGICEIKNIIIQ